MTPPRRLVWPVCSLLLPGALAFGLLRPRRVAEAARPPAAGMS